LICALFSSVRVGSYLAPLIGTYFSVYFLLSKMQITLSLNKTLLIIFFFLYSVSVGTYFLSTLFECHLYPLVKAQIHLIFNITLFLIWFFLISVILGSYLASLIGTYFSTYFLLSKILIILSLNKTLFIILFFLSYVSVGTYFASLSI